MLVGWVNIGLLILVLWWCGYFVLDMVVLCKLVLVLGVSFFMGFVIYFVVIVFVFYFSDGWLVVCVVSLGVFVVVGVVVFVVFV